MMEDSNQTDNNIQERLARKRKYVDSPDPGMSGGDMSLELLPDLILLEIFSFLPVRDLNNVRLVSTRMSRSVLTLDKRFKTWTFDVSRDLPEETDKVFDYNLNIRVKISQSMNYNTTGFYTWLIKHSSCITDIKLSEYSLPGKVIDSLSQLKQVRKLELELRKNNKEDAVKTLLISLGPKLESLTVRNLGGFAILNETNLNLASLKHLKIEYCNREMISSILKIVPANIQSLELIGSDIEIPSGMKQLNNLKYLRIQNYFEFYKLELPAMLLCKSLTRLDLYGVDLEDLELLDTDLPSLKILKLQDCKIKMGLFKNLLKKSAQSLHKLHLYWTSIIDNEDLDCSLSALTSLELGNMKNINWLSQLISACSTSLTTLKLSSLNSCSLDELTCYLPLLTTLELKNMSNIKGLSQLISACSTSLTTLKLQSCSLDELSCDLPVLTSLELNYMRNITGLSQLISACSRSLTTLKLSSLDSCSLDELTCDLPALKVMTITRCRDLDINNFLRKCSSSLQILYLEDINVKFEVNVPNLKELHMRVPWGTMRHTQVDGFTNLVSPQNSSLEIIGLDRHVSGSIWDDIERCRFSNMKVVYMSDEVPDKIEKLKTSIITPHVQ